jgi:RNA polymerase sigma-70 factor (TIGR02943 family)
MPIDNSNIENWVDEYASILLAFTVVRVNDNSIAEDIVQETFISAWKNRENFKGEASTKNWLFKICKNKIIDHYRKKARTPIQYAEADNANLFFDNEEHWVMANGPTNWGINYDQPVEQKEFYNILDLCRKRLQEMQQRVFVLKYLEDMDSDEICKLLNISSSNYWVLIHRAKLQLRACLEKNWINL